MLTPAGNTQTANLQPIRIACERGGGVYNKKWEIKTGSLRKPMYDLLLIGQIYVHIFINLNTRKSNNKCNFECVKM